MNFFDHKDLGNHLLQLCPKVVKHPVFIVVFLTEFIWPYSLNTQLGWHTSEFAILCCISTFIFIWNFTTEIFRQCNTYLRNSTPLNSYAIDLVLESGLIERFFINFENIFWETQGCQSQENLRTNGLYCIKIHVNSMSTLYRKRFVRGKVKIIRTLVFPIYLHKCRPEQVRHFST